MVLTEISKAFDSIPHDLLIEKLSAYGLSSDFLCYIYPCLKDGKQCVQKNNKQSEFDTVISGVPQGSIFGPILFQFFQLSLFFLFQKGSFIILRMTILLAVSKKHSGSSQSQCEKAVIGFTTTKWF